MNTTAQVLPGNHASRLTPHFKDGRLLNQYQGGMCISGSLTMTERTPRRLISPLGPN